MNQKGLTSRNPPYSFPSLKRKKSILLTIQPHNNINDLFYLVIS